MKRGGLLWVRFWTRQIMWRTTEIIGVNIRSGKTGNQLKNNKQQVVDDEGPFASPFVCSNSEDDGSDGTKHENEGDSLEIIVSKISGRCEKERKKRWKQTQVISFFDTLNSVAREVTVIETVKKSNASRVQAQNAIKKNFHCFQLRVLKVVKGLGGASIPFGTKVVNRVTAYLPADIDIFVVVVFLLLAAVQFSLGE